MWLIALISLLNACLNNRFVNSEGFRIDVAGLPINVYDVLLMVALVWSVLPASSSYFRTGHVHKALIWAIALCFAALTLGTIAAIANPDSLSRSVITTIRNFMMVPVCTWVGYRCTRNLNSALGYCYVVVLCGLFATGAILLDFGAATESLKATSDITNVRIVQYVSNYGGLAAGLLLFCVGFKGKPLLPRWPALIVAGVCCVGQCATLSRSDWLAVAAGLVAAVAIMPAYTLNRKLLTSLIAFPVIIGCLFVAMFAVQSVTGRDIMGKMGQRVASILPWQQDGVASASSTRIAGTLKELELWRGSPVWGNGFGIHDALALDDWVAAAGGFRHNTWTSTMAETGLLGLAAMGLMCFGQIVIGYRMVRDRLDRRTVLIGALGVITGCHYFVHGLCTMSFNAPRFAIPVALTFGVVLRVRAIERAIAQEYAGYLPDASQLDTSLPLTDVMGAAPAAHGGYETADELAYGSPDAFAAQR